MKKKSEESKEKKKAAIYCRVSTYEQGKGNFSSLDSQEKINREYCERNGWIVVGVYSDTRTGTTLERDELSRLLKDASEHKFDVIAVTKLDRISRSVKDFLELDQKLITLNVEWAITTQHIDTTTPAGKMQRTIMLAFAEFERDMIAERTREKLYSQAQNGYWGGGNVPLGYDCIDKKLIVNEQEAALVNRIFEYYLNEPSTNKVAKRLNSEGYRTKSRTTKEGKKIGNTEFNNQHVHDTLRNRLYLGLVTFKKEEFAGLHKAIVDEKLFDAVQDRLAKSKVDRRATYDESDLLLLGLTKCGFCNGNLTTSFMKADEDKKYLYYKCTTKSKFGAKKCDSRDLPADKLESLIENVIIHIGLDDSFFEAVYTQITENDNVDFKGLKRDREILNGNLARIIKEQDNVANFIAQARSDLDIEVVTDKLKQLTKQRREVEEALTNANRKIELIETQKISKGSLRELYGDFAQIYSKLNKEKKRKLTQAVISEITCKIKKKESAGQIQITFRGNGTDIKDWNLDENPEKTASSFRVDWLLGQDSNLQPIG